MHVPTATAAPDADDFRRKAMRGERLTMRAGVRAENGRALATQERDTPEGQDAPLTHLARVVCPIYLPAPIYLRKRRPIERQRAVVEVAKRL